MFKKVIFLLACLLSVSPWLNPALALLFGLAFTLFLGNPFAAASKVSTNWFLKIAIVFLGFGINAKEALDVSANGLWLTILSISITLALGVWLTKLLRLELKAGYLISSGTAICGGSAIAAISPIIKASTENISMAMGTVFLLNSIALLIFPPIGRWLELTQQEFGLWSAIAIHDTSSVVGAAAMYGAEALKIATTVKLARALWIIPLAVATGIAFKNKGKIKYPYFIGLFIIAMLGNTFLPLPDFISVYAVLLAKKIMSLTLFLIGSSLSIEQIKMTAGPSFLLGIILWVLIAVGSLSAIMWL
jgi:uncharacterized integral membrane protein (TIGR00698 family)